MHTALLLIGAHNGHKQRDLILRSAGQGATILVEPVPYLFAELQAQYAGQPNITCLNACITPQPGKVAFYAPTPQAIQAFPWGDQLGSLHPQHAVQHEQNLAPHIEQIEAEGITFDNLVDRFAITSLEMLFTDTEGYDATLLPLFPFDRVRPRQIIFEHKHADGTFNIGRKLGTLLILLDTLGYNVHMLDPENCLATTRR